jgi:hypothetical protein
MMGGGGVLFFRPFDNGKKNFPKGFFAGGQNYSTFWQ